MTPTAIIIKMNEVVLMYKNIELILEMQGFKEIID